MSKRFLINREDIRDAQALLEGPQAHHLLHVMRLKPGDPVVLFDGGGTSYQGVIERTSPKKVWICVRSSAREPEALLRISLFCAWPKHGKIDAIVEKSAELGVDAIGAVVTERTVPRLDPSRKEARLKRWQRIAQEACKQSGGNRLPKILGIFSFEETLGLRKDAFGIFLTPKAEASLTAALPESLAGEIFLLVGPEGGWSKREEDLARSSGWHPVTLWDRILKVDTACLAAISIIHSLTKSGVPGATRTPDI